MTHDGRQGVVRFDSCEVFFLLFSVYDPPQYPEHGWNQDVMIIVSFVFGALQEGDKSYVNRQKSQQELGLGLAGATLRSIACREQKYRLIGLWRRDGTIDLRSSRVCTNVVWFYATVCVVLLV